jgi:predicted solute-binding protein
MILFILFNYFAFHHTLYEYYTIVDFHLDKKEQTHLINMNNDVYRKMRQERKEKNDQKH